MWIYFSSLTPQCGSGALCTSCCPFLVGPGEECSAQGSASAPGEAISTWTRERAQCANVPRLLWAAKRSKAQENQPLPSVVNSVELQVLKKGGYVPQKQTLKFTESTDSHIGKYVMRKNKQATMAASVVHKIRQSRISKDLIAYSCSMSALRVQTIPSKEKFCLHLAHARWHHLLDPSGLLVVGDP